MHELTPRAIVQLLRERPSTNCKNGHKGVSLLRPLADAIKASAATPPAGGAAARARQRDTHCDPAPAGFPADTSAPCRAGSVRRDRSSDWPRALSTRHDPA